MSGSVCGPAAPGPVEVLPAARDSEVVGFSVEGRPLAVHYRGDPGATLRIFILAGQHGDEADAREAAAEFLDRMGSRAFRAPVQVAAVADANPDGAAAASRRNAADIDLNRDHLLLAAPETAAVHAFVETWKPDLILDVHTYRAWRRELLPYGFVFAQEIMIDFPTNPAVRTMLGPETQRRAMDFIESRLTNANIRCDRYTLIRPGTVRHSTADVIDARNNLALRFEVPVVLLEGRRASPDDSLKFMPPRAALVKSLEAVVEWAAGNAERLVKRPAGSGTVPIRCRYAGSKASRYMEMQSVTRGEISRVRIPGSYLPSPTATKSVRKPHAYAVPTNMTGVREILTRHGFEAVNEPGRIAVEIYRVEALLPAGEEDFPALPVCSTEPGWIDGGEYAIYPARQTGGNLLALLLEPESQFGPQRVPDLAAALQPGMKYPVARLAEL